MVAARWAFEQIQNDANPRATSAAADSAPGYRVWGFQPKVRSGISASPAERVCHGELRATSSDTRALTLLLDEPVVFGMRANPYPEHVGAVFHGKRAVVESYAD